MTNDYQQKLTNLARLISQHSNNLVELLDALLTPQEIIQLSKRVEIIRRLKAGQPQRQIAHDLEVGLATVIRGAKEMRLGKFKHILERKGVN